MVVPQGKRESSTPGAKDPNPTMDMPTSRQVYSLKEAVQIGNHTAVKRLLKIHNIKAEKYIDDKTNKTLLHVASKLGHVKVAALLIDHDKSGCVGRTDRLDNTPLHYAAAGGCKAMVLLLLENGADDRLLNAAGKRPSDLAAANGYADLKRAILDYDSPFYRERPKFHIPVEQTEENVAIRTQLALLQQKERVKGEQHISLVVTLKKLVDLYLKEDRIDDAMQCARRLFLITKEAALHQDLDGMYEENIIYFGKVLNTACSYEKAIKVLSLGISLPNLNYSMYRSLILEVTTSYYSLKRYDECETLLTKLIALLEDELSSDHPKLCKPLSLLAFGFLKRKQFQLALPHYAKILAIADMHLGGEHVDIAISLDNLANVFYQMGGFVEAELLFDRALQIRKAVLPHDHRDVEVNRNNLSMAIIARKQHKK